MNHLFKTISVACMLCFLCLTGCQEKTLSQIDSQQITLADSIRIVYKTYGSGNEPLVFVHGFGCNIDAWDSQFDYFKDQTQLVFIDLPGYGKSDRPHTEYTLNFYADAVKAVLDALNINKAVLVGHSLGTAISRQVVYNEPERISKLIDVDGVYCFFPEDSLLRADLEAQYAAFVTIFEGDDMQQAMKSFIEPLFVEQTPEHVKQYALSTMTQTPQYVAYSTMKNMVEEKYWSQGVIQIPSLIIAAKNSQIPADYKEIMQMLYSDMQYEELDSIGHFIMMEKPEMFNQMLKDFLNK